MSTLQPFAADEAPAPASGDEALPTRAIVVYVAAYFGAYLILIVPAVLTLALRVGELVPQSKESALGLITGIGAMVALVSNPVFGALSDRTTSRWGMRRPWLFCGVVVGFVAVTLGAFTSSILVLGVAWAFTQLGMNAVLNALSAFLPDHVPAVQRGKVSAYAGVAQQFGPFIGILIANVSLAMGFGTSGMFVLPAVIGLAFVLLYGFTMRDRVLPRELRPALRKDFLVRTFLFNPRRNPDFGWAWLGRFLIVMGMSATLTYGVYFLGTRLKLDTAGIARTQLLVGLITIVLASISGVVAGLISDRTGRRKVFVIIASLLAAAGSVIMAFAHDLTAYLIACVITGVATGAYYAVDLALVTDVLPDKEQDAAKHMGVLGIANTLPQSLAPALAPLLLSVGGGGNYYALYLAAAVCAVLGALTILPIKKVR